MFPLSIFVHEKTGTYFVNSKNVRNYKNAPVFQICSQIQKNVRASKNVQEFTKFSGVWEVFIELEIVLDFFKK